jgi:hypothetical protein
MDTLSAVGCTNRFSLKRSPFRRKKLEQAGRLDHGSGAAHVGLVRRASQE